MEDKSQKKFFFAAVSAPFTLFNIIQCPKITLFNIK